jgi:hypothetical protein
MAEQADRHTLYQKSVQEPQAEIELMTEKFFEIRGRKPVSLREDFCGTAYLSVAWCLADPAHTAIGVDLCGDTLEWGKQHNLAPVADRLGERLTLINGNVLDSDAEKTDINCAFNFSYNIFKTREQLLEYFRAARNSLNDDGVLFLDIYGGTEAYDALEEEREVDDEEFTYVWDQEKYNPVTGEMLCHIHFNFPDKSKIHRAFSYDWRLWSIPEVTEVLREAGFSEARVYWEEFEDTDDDDEYLEGTGDYRAVTEVENQESWVSYIAALA